MCSYQPALRTRVKPCSHSQAVSSSLHHTRQSVSQQLVSQTACQSLNQPCASQSVSQFISQSRNKQEGEEMFSNLRSCETESNRACLLLAYLSRTLNAEYVFLCQATVILHQGQGHRNEHHFMCHAQVYRDATFECHA